MGKISIFVFYRFPCTFLVTNKKLEIATKLWKECTNNFNFNWKTKMISEFVMSFALFSWYFSIFQWAIRPNFPSNFTQRFSTRHKKICVVLLAFLRILCISREIYWKTWTHSVPLLVLFSGKMDCKFICFSVSFSVCRVICWITFN